MLKTNGISVVISIAYINKYKQYKPWIRYTVVYSIQSGKQLQLLILY